MPKPIEPTLIYGFHTPVRTTDIFKILSARTDYTYIDASWKNDTCDSLLLEETQLHIMLPNSEQEIASQELFSSFITQPMEDYASDLNSTSFDDIEKLITHLNNSHLNKNTL